MGMAASQARLLSITARLTNNENSGQSISYAKQRLSDQTQQITNEYNEALSATKLTVLTGFNGADANYTDISYSLMTGPEMAANTKQYVVTDTKGKVLVTKDIADAFSKSCGEYNQFLAGLGYSQSDMTVQNVKSLSDTDKAKAANELHNAWDKYFASVGINLGDAEHDGFLEEFSWQNTWSVNDKGQYLDKNGNVLNTDGMSSEQISNLLKTSGYSFVGSGYTSRLKMKTDDNGNIQYHTKTDNKGEKVPDYSSPIILDKDGNEIAKDYDSDGDGIADSYSAEAKKKFVYTPINYEGTTDESRELYDYAMALTESFMRTEESLDTADKKAHNQYYDMSNYKSASNSDNKAMLTYYKNIFTKMKSSGYFTYSETLQDAIKDPDHYKYTSKGTGTAGNVQKSPLKDNSTFEAALRDGSLRLEYYSTTSKSFKSTTIADDNCIQEVSDERAIAKAESKYNQDMTDLENKDKKLDLELKKLDTEHSALQTEYESVKNVVSKNVENSFKTFG